MSIGSILSSILFLCVGFVCAWLLARAGQAQLDRQLAEKNEQLRQQQAALDAAQHELSSLREERAAAIARVAALEATLTAERNAAQDKTTALLAFEEKLQGSFASLAASALDANTRRLLALSQQELDKQKQAATSELAKKETAIQNLLQPMTETLNKLSAHSQQLEVQREGAYRAMMAEIQNLQRSQVDLRRETTQLVQALRAPKVRGNWGEMQLRRCIEFAGMVEHASFEVEKFVRGEDHSVRPDVVVQLPNHRTIIIDAKTPLDAFMNASACEDEVQRQHWLQQHASAVRQHLDSLSSKAYWNRFRESPDFVVCFLPSEVLFSAALEQDPSLLEHSANTSVLLATPTTLIALLKAVAYGWQQSQIARDAETIRTVATNLHKKFVGMHRSFLDIGKNLKKAGDAYDDALNKAEGHGGLFSIARKLRDLKIGESDLPAAEPITMRPRVLQHEDWESGLALAAMADDDPVESSTGETLPEVFE